MSRPDVIVIGGGPAGSAAAIHLARGGARVLLVEKTRGAHHKVCGEFVSDAARQLLSELGIDRNLLEAVPITTIRLLQGDRIAQSALPFPASSLSRKILDEALLRIASESGVEIRRGTQVREVSLDGQYSTKLSDGSRIAAAALFLATGKHELRGMPRGSGIQNGLIGLKMHFDLEPRQQHGLAGAVELLFFEGGYAGLQLVEKQRANLCLLVSKPQFEAVGRSWSGLIDVLAATSPHWRERLAGARPYWKQPLAIYNLPYGYVTDAQTGPVFRIGDQLAVVPSFAGDGMAIALSSGKAAAEAYLAGEVDAASFHARMAEQIGPRVRASAWGARLLEYPMLQAAAVSIAAHAPGLLARAAEATRIGGRESSAA